jgi:peptide-N4-(N-acetyl-beta-glucosaminyl)asparagine amidase
MYESGWNKKLSHILSFSRYGVIDASPRYSRKLDELIIRRDQEVVSECFILEAILGQDQYLEQNYALKLNSLSVPYMEFAVLDILPFGESGFENFSLTDIPITEMKKRKEQLSKEMEGLVFLTAKSWKAEEMRGRISGDEEWKLSRGEAGTVVEEKVCKSSCNLQENDNKTYTKSNLLFKYY